MHRNLERRVTMDGAPPAADKRTVEQQQQKVEELSRVATLVSVTVTFQTTEEGKDFDTALTMQIMKGIRALARTSQPIYGQFSPHSQCGPFGLNPIGVVNKDDLTHSAFTVHVAPQGPDRWRFATRLDLTFSDNSHKIYTWTGQVVDQANPNSVHQL